MVQETLRISGRTSTTRKVVVDREEGNRPTWPRHLEVPEEPADRFTELTLQLERADDGTPVRAIIEGRSIPLVGQGDLYVGVYSSPHAGEPGTLNTQQIAVALAFGDGAPLAVTVETVKKPGNQGAGWVAFEHVEESFHGVVSAK